MGDRANVYIHEENRAGVYLYTHWNGTELPRLVQDALNTDRAISRKDDIAYLTRILIEEIIGDDRGSETGWGVSADVGDGEDRIVDITVRFGSDPEVKLIGYEDEYEEDWDQCDCDYCLGYIDGEEDWDVDDIVIAPA